MESLLSKAFESQHPEEIVLPIVVLFIMLLVLVALLALLVQVGALYNVLQGKTDGETWQSAIKSYFNDMYMQQAGLQPITAEADMMLDHDYDGIKELDNHLPPWWKNLFWVTIIFSGIYGVLYHWTGSWDLQLSEYENELAVAKVEKEAWEKQQVNSISESTAKLLTDAGTLEEGKKLFTTNCTACHAADAGGGVGPNLTDDYWLHGNKIGDVFKTIKYGVPGKGMTAWQATLNPKQIQAVSSYVISLRGTKPAAPKEPQGNLVSAEESKAPANNSTESAQGQESASASTGTPAPTEN
jgi:cytochrome c oxidase cbb3-type subunit 3